LLEISFGARLYRNGQPVPVGQVGIGIACEITELWVRVTGAVGFVVNAPARTPANTAEKIDVWTKSFMVCLPPDNVGFNFV
jgi:hypothetical protein